MHIWLLEIRENGLIVLLIGIHFYGVEFAPINLLNWGPSVLFWEDRSRGAYDQLIFVSSTVISRIVLRGHGVFLHSVVIYWGRCAVYWMWFEVRREILHHIESTQHTSSTSTHKLFCYAAVMLCHSFITYKQHKNLGIHWLYIPCKRMVVLCFFSAHQQLWNWRIHQ